ncbi:DUF4190 domain-containing protein [Lacisediminihabitans changchengi]|uniref:DUF4190 domain-containing protein n=1 Tax=Lacisediminihabitans changchengi TaxID=2787634 RepID=A0A934SKH2_9MICO|nr:DUF4190 domain-containing protein [Lacisediminihabitans changchengi]MBK4348352.1 DUF4190 domain-containing protein [Lacisediminihabitans changchengi]
MSTTPPPPATPPAYSPGTPAPVAKTNTLAIVGFVLGFVVSLGAVVVSHIALAQIKRTGEAGRGFAIAGLILGYVGIFFGIIWVIIIIVGIIAGASSGSFDSGNY